MTRPAALALVLALAALPAAARAQTAAQTTAQSDAPAGSRVDEAQRHIAEGLQRFRQRDYSAAIQEFELANAAVPTPELWFNIARAREMLLDYRGAVDDLRRYLRDKVDPPDRAEVERHIVELERLDEIRRAAQSRQAVGQTMRVEVEGGAATVVLDGRAQSAAALATPVATGEGSHRVEVLRPGMQPWVAQVRVRAGESAAVFSNPAASTVYRTRPAPHVASAILGGLGVVAFGVSAYFGVRAATEDCNACDARWNAADRSDLLLGTGALLAVGAAVAFFVERASSTTVTQR
ncbi:MAG: Thiol-disulfide isomerase [Myxococcaceae bacterium]|nr:Thiol-disulfide isomerase [Myxococcaceae bacterium]